MSRCHGVFIAKMININMKDYLAFNVLTYGHTLDGILNISNDI